VNSAALHQEDVHRLIAFGRDVGKTAAQTYGLIALGEVGIGNTTVAAALAAALLELDATTTVGLGAASDTDILDRKRAVVAQSLARARAARDVTDPIGALVEVGGPEIAVLAGVVLGAATGGAAIVLDGLAVTLAGLVAVRLEPGAQAHLIAGQRSREKAQPLALAELGLEAVLDIRLRAGEGVGAILTTQLLMTALEARANAARVR
jgi:nicotinate-nucleotide--dimethylbenzimidazole phosphoribosyltransferase